MQCIVVKSVNSRIRTPLYTFFLNPVYVAARSLRSLRPQQWEMSQTLRSKKFVDMFCFVFIMLKHEGALYKEVFPGKIEAHLSVTIKVRGSNSKWRAIWIQER